MGNHDAGHKIVIAATLMSERRRDGESAIEILDRAVEIADAMGADAEFDDDANLDTPLGTLITEAFAPSGRIYDPESEDDQDAWYDDCYQAFSDRFGLC